LAGKTGFSTYSTLHDSNRPGGGQREQLLPTGQCRLERLVIMLSKPNHPLRGPLYTRPKLKQTSNQTMWGSVIQPFDALDETSSRGAFDELYQKGFYQPGKPRSHARG